MSVVYSLTLISPGNDFVEILFWSVSQENLNNCLLWEIRSDAPTMTMAGALSVTSVCLSVHPSICLYIHHTNNVHSLSQIVLIRIIWNLVTVFSTIMSSSSWIMVHIAPCLQELLPCPLFIKMCHFRLCENIQILQQQGHLCPLDTFLDCNVV